MRDFSFEIVATHEGQKGKGGKKATTQEFRIQSRTGLVWVIEFQNRFVFHYMGFGWLCTTRPTSITTKICYGSKGSMKNIRDPVQVLHHQIISKMLNSGGAFHVDIRR